MGLELLLELVAQTAKTQNGEKPTFLKKLVFIFGGGNMVDYRIKNANNPFCCADYLLI